MGLDWQEVKEKIERFRDENAGVTSPHRTSINNAHWSPPADGCLKINVDASPGVDDGVGIGVVVRDEQGNFISIGCWWYDVRWSAAVSEARALWHALMFVRNKGLDNVVVESDAENLIKKLQRKEIGRGCEATVLESTLNSSVLFKNYVFSWTKRSGNELAHRICHWARHNRCTWAWEYNPPNWCCDLLLQDVDY